MVEPLFSSFGTAAFCQFILFAYCGQRFMRAVLRNRQVSGSVL